MEHLLQHIAAQMPSPIYPLIMVAAIVVGIVVSRLVGGVPELSRWQRIGLGIGAFCGAMLGAKLPFLLSDPEGMRSGIAWFSNGKTILCGLIGGYLGVELAKWALEIRVKTGDSFAVPVAAAIAVGRLGCYFGGCCFGTPTNMPWGVVFPHVDALPRHPTQLYESLFHATAAVLLFVMLRKGMFRGQLIKVYLIAYMGYRFLTEFIRPEVRLIGGLTGYQWAAVAFALLMLYLYRKDARRFRKESEGQLLAAR